MKKRTGIQPINKVESKIVKAHVDFPAAMGVSESVGLDVTLLEDLCRYVGIAHVTITTVSEKGTQQAIILGQDEGGGAHGGFVEAKGQTHSELMPLHSKKDQSPFRIGVWNTAVIMLDMDEIRANIMDSDKGLRDAGKWAEVLDRKIKYELLKVGAIASIKLEKDKMTLCMSYIITFDMALAYISHHIKSYIEKGKIDHVDGLLYVISMLVCWFIVRRGVNEGYDFYNKSKNKNRISVVNILGAEVDTLIIFTLQMIFSTLVHKVIPTQVEGNERNVG